MGSLFFRGFPALRFRRPVFPAGVGGIAGWFRSGKSRGLLREKPDSSRGSSMSSTSTMFTLQRGEN